MIKYRILFILLFVISLPMGIKSQNTIDAVTSASRKFKLKSGKAYARYATIVWIDEFDNGIIHEIRYGIDSTLDKKINLKPFTAKRDVTDTIPNLNPSTKYNAQFFREWNGEEVVTPFSFQTIASIGIKKPDIVHEVHSSPNMVTFRIYTIKGALLQEGVFPGNPQTLIRSTGVLPLSCAPGIYFMVVKDPCSHTVNGIIPFSNR